jgi:ribosomal protein L31
MDSVVIHLVYRSESFHLLPLKKLLRSIITKTTNNKNIYKTNSCIRHKDLKPVTVDIQKTSHSYIINQEQIENGK